MNIYAGIGSRGTPTHILECMERAAEALRDRDWTLRSGHAPGADVTFEAAAREMSEIYLPWPNFNPKEPVWGLVALDHPTLAAQEIAARHSEHWRFMNHAARWLHARNAHIILGADLATPVRFVLCWTPLGKLDGQEPGGTGAALRIATAYDVERINLARSEHLDRVMDFIADLS
jgi:hypothetical protein